MPRPKNRGRIPKYRKISKEKFSDSYYLKRVIRELCRKKFPFEIVQYLKEKYGLKYSKQSIRNICNKCKYCKD